MNEGPPVGAAHGRRIGTVTMSLRCTTKTLCKPVRNPARGVAHLTDARRGRWVDCPHAAMVATMRGLSCRKEPEHIDGQWLRNVRSPFTCGLHSLAWELLR